MAFYGDSYGGVQAAQQASTNSDRNFLMSLVAAQQRAQQLAMAQQEEAASRAQNWALNQQRMAQEAEMFNAKMDAVDADRDYKEQMGLAELDFAERESDKTRAATAKKLFQDEQAKLKAVVNAGPVLAGRFSELMMAAKQADSDFAKTDAELLALSNKIAAAKSQDLIEQVGSDKFTYKPTGQRANDPTVKANVETWNSELRRLFNEAERKDENRKKAATEFAQHLRVIQSSGFLPGQGALVFPKTGQSFPIPQAAVNSPRVRKFNFHTETLQD